MSHKSPFGSASHLENIGSWKAGSPVSNPGQKLNLDNCSLLWWPLLHGNMGPTSQDATTSGLEDHKQKLHCNNWEHKHCIVTVTYRTPWPNPLLLCTRLLFFPQLQGRDGHEATIMQNLRSVLRLSAGREWRLRFHKRHGFLKQTCGTKPFSAVRPT